MKYLPRSATGKWWFIAMTLCFFIITLLPGSFPVQAAAGDLDLTFGSGGKLTTSFNGRGEAARAVAIQPDGKIVVAGYADLGERSLFALLRYNRDGSLDNTFGNGGKSVVDFDFVQEGHALVIQPDGRIIVGGSYSGSLVGQAGHALIRYNSNGSPDMSFGEGGLVTTPFMSGQETAIRALAVQQDGKILAAGSIGSFVFSLVRYNANGSLDTSFGGSGIVITVFFNYHEGARGLAIQTDGKIVVAGNAYQPSLPTVEDFALIRYNQDGSLDNTFGNGGKVLTDFADMIGTYDLARAVVLQPDGKIIAAGVTGIHETDFALARYNTNGSLDTSFGNAGKVKTDFWHNSDDASSVALLPDGKILVVGNAIGSQGLDFVVARYNPDGSLDSSFGSGGRASTDISQSNDYATGAVLQKDGNIVVAGLSRKISTPTIALARFIGTNFDFCLQDDSAGSTLQINSVTGDYQFSNCSGVTLGGKGGITNRGNTLTLGHNAGDRRVTVTIDRNASRATALLQMLTQARTFSITDRNILNNSCTCR
jgi:uncharacterized delta-60 repeat protein